MSTFELVFGLRQSYSILYDALDIYFREGGGSAYVSRVIGPAATKGTKTLLDGSAAISLTVSARDAGAQSANIYVGVVAGSTGGTFQIVVTDGTNTLEQSGDLQTTTDAVAWASLSNYIRMVQGASTNDPAVVAPAALSAGTDDRNNITDAQWQAALDLLTADLGPGQVSFPGRTSDVAHNALATHAQAHNRVALLDLADTNTAAVLKTAVVNARTGNQRFGGAWAPWTRHPGVVRGTTRTVPPSSLVAGLIARNETQFGPDSPSAGVRGQSNSAVAVSQDPWTDSVRSDLNDNSVNAIINRNGIIYVYGWRSLVAEAADPEWIGFANGRLRMAITAEAQAIAEQYVFMPIDGQGFTLSSFSGSLQGMLQAYYDQGALYGATAADAFRVDVGPSVNTPESIADNELRARLYVRMSPMAELVTIEIVKTPITQAVIA